MLEVLLNLLLFRKFRAKIVGKRFVACIQSEFTETFLDVLLNLISLLICVDKDFRKNLKDFEARYLNEEVLKCLFYATQSMGGSFSRCDAHGLSGEIDFCDTVIYRSVIDLKKCIGCDTCTVLQSRKPYLARRNL